MNGVHDMGGMQSFGPITAEADQPVFHADWESRAFALTLAMAAPGGWNLDMSRYARESLPPAQYLSSSYYEVWLAALERLMIARGLVTEEELSTGTNQRPSMPVSRILRAEDVAVTLGRGGPVSRDPETPAIFGEGDLVRARNLHPAGHTRLPRYVRGAVGTIVRVHGCHVFPDTNAHGHGEQPRWLYNVAFSARDLWGTDAGSGDSVHLDLWEPYLEPA